MFMILFYVSILFAFCLGPFEILCCYKILNFGICFCLNNFPPPAVGQTQGLTHDRQALGHWATAPELQCGILNMFVSEIFPFLMWKLRSSSPSYKLATVLSP